MGHAAYRSRIQRVALLLLGSLLFPTVADAAVERLDPDLLYLDTSMSSDIPVYYYAPPIVTTEETDKETGAASPPAGKNLTPVILYSGAWGWRPMMQDTASYLAASGRHVLGIDSPAYYKRLVKPEGLAADLRLFRSTINKRAGRAEEAPLLLAGFDMGAENIPYILNRASVSGLLGVLLMAPAKGGSAVFRVAVHLDLPIPEEEKIDVAAELAALPALPLVMMQGALDGKGAGKELMRHVKPPKLMASIPAASHNFREVRDVYFQRVSDALAWLERRAARRRPRPRPAARPAAKPAPEPVPDPPTEEMPIPALDPPPDE